MSFFINLTHHKVMIFKAVFIMLWYYLPGHSQYSSPTGSTSLPTRSTRLFTRSTRLSTVVLVCPFVVSVCPVVVLVVLSVDSFYH